jgi:hypothetical protein
MTKKPVKSVRKEHPSENRDEVDVVALLRQADFVPDDVLDAAAKNTVFFVKACQYRLECMKRKSTAEFKLKHITSETDLRIRKDARDDDEKITEAGVKARLTLDTEVSDAQKVFDDAEIFDEYSKLVCEIFRMRRDCLRIVEGTVRSEMSIGRAADEASEVMSMKRSELERRFPGSRSSRQEEDEN